MLNNNFFADLVKKPVRYDLKQVQEWDKEIESITKKKSKPQKQTQSKAENEPERVVDSGYRDRAEERRREQASEESVQLEAMVARLDAEQTKFLGGDMEHTHLVKGLDYALLRKVKEEAEKIRASEASETQKMTSMEPNLPFNSSVVTNSSFGEKIKKVLSSQASAKSCLVQSDAISRTVYEYEMDTPECLPIVVMKSKQETEDLSSFISCSLGDSFLEKLKMTLTAAGTHTKRKRDPSKAASAKQPDKVEVPVAAATTVSARISQKSSFAVDDIYGDLVDGGVGKYVIEEVETGRDPSVELSDLVAVNGSLAASSCAVSWSDDEDGEVVCAPPQRPTVRETETSAKGLFSGLVVQQEESKNSKPERDSADFKSLSTLTQKVVPNDSIKKVNRDAITGQLIDVNGKVSSSVDRGGLAMNSRNDEVAIDNEFMESDDEEAGQKSKKPKKQQQQHQSAPTSRAAPSGLNRAARRAAQRDK